MQLVPTPDNPLPPGSALVPVQTADGLALRVARFDPPGSARGTVVILQGRAEFIEKYFETVADLLGRGFAVVAFDWRGQGCSDRETAHRRKGHVRDFGRYQRDLDAVAEQCLEALMPPPHFALAHSMGAAVALIAAREGRLPVRRLVALAPMCALPRTMTRRPRRDAALARLLTLLGLGEQFIPGGGETSIATQPFEGNRLTSDPARYARNAAAASALGDAAIGDPTVAWVNAAFKAMARLAEPRFALEMTVPTLVVAAGADAICSTPAAERFASRLKAGHAIVIPGSRHEILMERDSIRAAFFAAFDAFVPGTQPTLPKVDSGLEQLERRRVEPAIAGGDDGATLGG